MNIKQTYMYAYIRYAIKKMIPAKIYGDERYIKRKFKKNFGYELDLDNPKTINEKTQWLKLHDRRAFNTLCADKLRVREYLAENFGKEYLVPLLYTTENWKDITCENIPKEPCVIKANTGSGTFKIVHDPSELDYKALQTECRKWMYLNHYYDCQEWQYKNIKPCIMVEKLLLTKDGKIPCDYKLHYINGKLQFIYCMIDREGKAYRVNFTPDWELLPFQWVPKHKYKEIKEEITEPAPQTLAKMIEIGDEIAKNFDYVRVDFYDVDGQLYYGEITLYHGSGYNHFLPDNKYDRYYGDMLKLTERK